MIRLMAFLCGSLFGLGLIVSDMANPARVIAFLDVTGAWDPSLALVMIGALIPSVIAYRWARARNAPPCLLLRYMSRSAETSIATWCSVRQCSALVGDWPAYVLARPSPCWGRVNRSHSCSQLRWLPACLSMGLCTTPAQRRNDHGNRTVTAGPTEG